MVKIGTAFRNLWDRIRASVSLKAHNGVFFFALTLVVILAIMIRLTPLLRGPLLIKAFDPWIQYYNAKYISEHSLYEYFTWHDKKSWYPGGMDRSSLRPGLPFTAVVIYLILNFIGIPVTIYEVCYYFPAFMGGVTVLAAYFLGKEVYDRNCGLFTAFFLALNTGHMQRTMAGFFDNETIGVFATLMCLTFFLKALRTGKFTHSIIGGIFLGYLSLSWGGYEYVFYMLPIVCLILILMNKYNENVLISYTGVIGTGFLIFSLYANFNSNNFITDLSEGGIFFTIIILTLFHLLYIKRKDYPRFYEIFLNTLKWGLLPGIITVAVIIWEKPEWIPLGIGGRLHSVLSPLAREQMAVVSSVAEHAPSAWSIFYYNTLIPLLLLPLGIFFCFKRLQSADILIMVFLLTLFYFTGSMIRIILLFAPAAAVVGSYGLVNVLKIYGSFTSKRRISPSRKRRRQLKRTVSDSEVFMVYLLVGFLCTAQIFHATDISMNQLSYSQMVSGGEFHDWEESLVWMKNNVDGTDVVVSWWDYGYWLTPVGNVTTVNDNNTHDGKRMGLTGMALMQTDEMFSAKIFRELEADYVLVYFGFLLTGFGGDEGKWPWMIRICNEHYEAYLDDGLEEDNWGVGEVFNEDDFINETSGLYRDDWFDSTLVKLMFYDEPTSASGVNPNTDYLRWYYASQIGGNPSQGISARLDDEGDEWKDHIPSGGQYDFKVFKPAYFSKNGLVKLYKLDYTALDSSFSIQSPNVYDTGYASCQLKNTGIKDLIIKNVTINGINYDFITGKGGNELKTGQEDVVWVDLGSNVYDTGDVVNIEVITEADALEGSKYEFSETTKNLFVTEAIKGEIKINRKNSKAVLNGAQVDVTLEVENVGNIIENLDKFYVNTNDNTFNINNSQYLEGSSVIQPGETTTVKLFDAPAEFYSAAGVIGNKIGVITTSGLFDETIFSINSENQKLSILSEVRTLSPELIAIDSNETYRNQIPIDFSGADTYAYHNGTIRIEVENTGESILGLSSVYVAKADSVKNGDIYELTEDNLIDPIYWNTKNDESVLFPGGQNTIIIYTSSLGIDIDVNDELAIAVKANGFEIGNPIASDIGIVHAINTTRDVRILKQVDQTISSYILANETGVMLLKNTGNSPINLTNTNIYINDTVTLDTDGFNFEFGDEDLAVQDCALISFDFNNLGLQFNKSNDAKVNITIDSMFELVQIFNVLENSPNNPNYYDIEINETNTRVIGINLEIKIDNLGKTLVTLDSVYINDTYVPLSEFSPFNPDIDIGSSLTIFLPDTYGYFVDNDPYKILVITKEGAEDLVDHHTV